MAQLCGKLFPEERRGELRLWGIENSYVIPASISNTRKKVSPRRNEG